MNWHEVCFVMKHISIMLNPFKSERYGTSVYDFVRNSCAFVLSVLIVSTMAGVVGANPIIHEIHYDTVSSSERVEYIELRNTTGQSVNMNNWFFDKGINFTFPNVSIPANGYMVVAQNEADYLAKYGGAGTYVFTWDAGSQLSNSGEDIRLRRGDGTVADSVTYDVGDEWPVTGLNGRTIQVIHPELDRDTAGAWRAAAPTPRAINAAVDVTTTNSVVLFDRVRHRPKAPSSSSNVTVTVEIPKPIAGMTAALDIQAVEPGNYIAIADPAYSSTWSSRAMNATTNGTFEVVIPSSDSAMQHRNLVRYRIRINAPGQSEIVLPYADNPEPNFAFFVYDGLGNFGSTNVENLEQVPVYHLIAKAADVNTYILTGTTKLYPVTGTLVHDDEVYDHIRYRAKGRSERHTRSKRNMRFKSNKGNAITHTSDTGEDLSDKGDLAIYGGTLTGRERVTDGGRIDSGLSEGVAFKQFNLFGAPASPADWMHFRLIDSVQENPAEEQNGDFWGIYNIVNDYDSDFLDDQNLPRDFLYEYKDDEVAVYPPEGPFTFNNPTYDVLLPNVAIVGNREQISGNTTFFRNNFDLPQQYRFMAANELIAQNEEAYWAKHYHKMYHDDGFHLLPADFDGSMMAADVNIPSQAILRDAIIANATLNREWQGVLREYYDLFLPPSTGTTEGINLLIEQKARMVENPSGGTSLADIDRLRWNLGYTNLATEKNSLKTFFRDRRSFIFNNYLNDSSIPFRPSLTRISPSSYPANDLRFRTSSFSDPNGSASESIEWIVARITDPNNLPAAGSDDWHYEADPTWRSGVQNYTGGQVTLTVPQGVTETNAMYRVRVRHKDTTDRWSHWSNPITFTPTAPNNNPVSSLVINEIHYNPVAGPGLGDFEREFVEIRNISGSTVNLSGFRMSGGIDFDFPVGMTIPGNGYIVLAGRAEEFTYVYGFAPDGDYQGRLDNGGDTVVLRDAWDRELDRVEYGDGNTWGPAADGFGPSLELIDASSDNADGDNWLSIGPFGGTPKAANSISCNNANNANGANIPNVHFNEINYDSAAAADAGDWIELRNSSGATVNLNGWKITDGANSYTIGNISIANNGYRVFAEDTALFSAEHPGVSRIGPTGFSLSNGGESLILLNADGCIADLVQYDDDPPWETLADGNGATLALNEPSSDNALPWFWLAGANGGSPGSDNGFGNPCNPTPANIVINELNVDSSPYADPGDWVEFYNDGPNFANLAGWKFYDEGGQYTFPANTFIGVGQYLILAEDSFAFNAAFPGLQGQVQVLNGQGFTLRNKGERILLTNPEGCVVDDLEYDNNAPWPTGLGTGATLSLNDSGDDNTLPGNWQLGDGLGTPGADNSSAACPAPSQEVIVEEMDDASNWVDLYNTSGASIDLAGWTLSDGDEVHFFPSNSVLAANASIRVSSLNFNSTATFTLVNAGRCVVDEVTAVAGQINHPPTLAAPGPLTFNESIGNTFVFQGADLDPSQTLSYSLTGAPAGASISASGVLSWNPPENAGPGVVSFTVTVSDSFSPVATASRSVSITVNEVNRRPNLPTISTQNINEEALWTYDLNGSDPDIPAQQITHAILVGPPGLTIQGDTLSWTPTEAQGPGSFNVQVEVEDEDGLSRSRSFTINVAEVNGAPVFATPSVQFNTDERVLWLQQGDTAVDADALPLSYSLNGNVPAGLVFDPATRWMYWLPGSGDAGAYTFNLVATDQAGLSDAQEISLNVADVVVPPLGACVSTNVLVAKQSNWSYSELQATEGWRQPWADLSSWSSGPGVFGFGEVVNTTVPKINVLRTAFVHEFNANNIGDITSLVLRFRRDDGAAVFLNGVEVARDNMAAGPITANSTAASSVFTALDERSYYEFTIPVSALAEGPNILAASVHQIVPSSSDMNFDAELLAIRATGCVTTPVLDVTAYKQSGELQFNTDAGATYQVQCCDDLPSGTWTVLQTVTGTGNTMSYTDPDAPAAFLMRRIYRIARIP